MELLDQAAFDRLAVMGERVRAGIRETFAGAGFPGQVTGDGSLFRIHPHDRPIANYRDTHLSPAEAAVMARLHRGLLNRGVYLTTYGMGCLSLAMSDGDLDHLVSAVAGALRAELAVTA